MVIVYLRIANALNAQIANHQRAAEIANQQDATARYKANMEALSSALSAAGDAGGQAAAASIAASDIRLKENIEKLDTVDGINIYKFDYIDGEKDQVGVIAQEVESLPGVVITMPNGYLAVDYTRLPQAVQERIKELR